LINNQFSIQLLDSKIYVWGYHADYHFTALPLIDGQWHAIAMTYDGAGSLSLYVDHALVKTARVSSFNTIGDSNWLGTDPIDQFHYFGDLKSIAFYNYALNATEAATDYITE
jgi:hypothetical protein